MATLLRSALVLLLVLTIITGVAYPVAVTGIAQLLFPHEAHGSLVYKDGKPSGSTLIGQPFDDPKYFWGRPSSTALFPYNAAASSGSNLGPTNSALVGAIKIRIASLQAADQGNRLPIPVDLVTIRKRA
jgi:K+-transporting ATPase ATPase C chain